MCPGSGVIWPYRSWEHRATGTAREEAAQTWPCSPSRPPNEHEECQLVGWTLRNKGSQLGFICQSPAQQVVCKGSHPGREIVLRGGDSQTSWRSACILEVGVPMLPMEGGGWSTVPPPSQCSMPLWCIKFCSGTLRKVTRSSRVMVSLLTHFWKDS